MIVYVLAIDCSIFHILSFEKNMMFLEPFKKSKNMIIHYQQYFCCTEIQKYPEKKLDNTRDFFFWGRGGGGSTLCSTDPPVSWGIKTDCYSPLLY